VWCCLCDPTQLSTIPPTIAALPWKLLLLLYPFNGLFSRTTRVSRYQKGKTSLDLNQARDDEVLGWQWHQLDHIQTICTSLQTDNRTNTSLKFLQAGCSSWCPTNSVKALKALPRKMHNYAGLWKNSQRCQDSPIQLNSFKHNVGVKKKNFQCFISFMIKAISILKRRQATSTHHEYKLI